MMITRSCVKYLKEKQCKGYKSMINPEYDFKYDIYLCGELMLSKGLI